MTDPVATGRANFEEGKAFERRIADLYRLLHYQVEQGREFTSREADLFLTRRVGDLVIHRAIECKVGLVVAQHIDEFVAKLRLVRKEFPAAIGTIVSGLSFTPAVAAHAAAEGIQLTVARDLAQLIDGHAYAVKSAARAGVG
jgi:Restriction endonuclease